MQTQSEGAAGDGSFEVLRKRLRQHSTQLLGLAQGLNEARAAEFGQSEMKLIHRTRVRTENNCVARDIVQLEDLLLFGYNVFMGLKTETQVADVFSLYRPCVSETSFELEPVSLDDSFLGESGFTRDFAELYRYYKDTKLVQIVVRNEKLLAAFQIGERLDDIRVFRWSLNAQGGVDRYIDNRGERDIEPPPTHDFQWQIVQRDQQETGRFPHVNIHNEIFVETIGGDLTVKVENNTKAGDGIYSEPVDDATQSIDDGQMYWADVGRLILLKIRPYREEQWRYLVFNRDLVTVTRLDAIGQSCVSLPEDQGIIFPGGYYLKTGAWKSFDAVDGFEFKRKLSSPNGEDVLYLFYKKTEGQLGLLTYNMIEKTVQNPIYGHGYARANNGQIVLFSSEHEPSRVHPMQLWATPFYSPDYVSDRQEPTSELGRIGNAELVRGIADIFSIARAFDTDDIHEGLYVQAKKLCHDIFDNHYWLSDQPEIAAALHLVSESITLVLDEYERVKQIQQDTQQTLTELQSSTDTIVSRSASDQTSPQQCAQLLGEVRELRGRCLSAQQLRYVDQSVLAALEQQLLQVEASLAQKTLELLSQEDAFQVYDQQLETIQDSAGGVATVIEIEPLLQEVEETAKSLDIVSELLAGLEAENAVVKTKSIEQLSRVYSKVNQVRAGLTSQHKSLQAQEIAAEFGAQLTLLNQSLEHGLSQANTPEACEEYLARLLMQLETLEGQLSDHDEFLVEVFSKRELITEAFENRKQQLLDERQQQAQRINAAAERLLATIDKKAMSMKDMDTLNTFFAADAMVHKIRQLAEQLVELQASVQAEAIQGRVKAIQDRGIRQLRDVSDLYDDGGRSITLGRHQFSVNQQALNPVIMLRAGQLCVHLTGTEFYEVLDDPDLVHMADYWAMAVPSESTSVYRGEYLAFLAVHGNDQDHEFNGDRLGNRVHELAASRYKDGYTRGVHDHDGVKIANAYAQALAQADGFQYPQTSRLIAALFYHAVQHSLIKGHTGHTLHLWRERALAAAQLGQRFSIEPMVARLTQSMAGLIQDFAQQFQLLQEISQGSTLVELAAEYLVHVLMGHSVSFVVQRQSQDALQQFKQDLSQSALEQLRKTLQELRGYYGEQMHLCEHWLCPWLVAVKSTVPVEELTALLILGDEVAFRTSDGIHSLHVTGLLGDHGSFTNQTLSVSLADFRLKLQDHIQRVVPEYERCLTKRHQLIEDARARLKLSSFQAKPLSSFVRNRLINESYLPIIGDNLAKQMGAMGASKRTDLMGLLMMISPPGYGKTTLMEYVADRLGLIFMKINCPALGHDVVSLDPDQAPNSTAQQELTTLNLALEMSNNVMLYLDDIQHTHPEFLQKFISLCDGTRRIEGVWRGHPKTYDLRGKKFCVVMAGNPYTESGEVFKIPDMLANRADIYNLGDILGDMEEQFSLSYIENALTSNPVLARLATGPMEDVYWLIKAAQGQENQGALEQSIGPAEQKEMIAVLQHMFTIQTVVLAINQQYIASAAQNDQYRVEPPFKLQGSYRNMNKMTEKITAIMSDAELQQLIDDHYQGESQLLTTGAEDNLLKLRQLRGIMTDSERERWHHICDEFQRNKALGRADADAGHKIVLQLADVVRGLQTLQDTAAQFADKRAKRAQALERNQLAQHIQLKDQLAGVTRAIQNVATQVEQAAPVIPTPPEAKVEVINQPIPGLAALLQALAGTIEGTIFPLVRSLDKKLEIDLDQHHRLQDISQQLRDLSSRLP